MTDGRWKREPVAIESSLRAWLAMRIGPEFVLSLRGFPSTAGNSSDTVLFDVNDEAYVLRLPPEPDSFPLFPTYDLARQAAAMELVERTSSAPVPHVVWFERDETFFGGPFLVMDRIDGVPLPDNPPYVFGGWLMDASDEERARLEDGMVRVLAGIHDADTTAADLDTLDLAVPGDSPLRRHVAHQHAYHHWIASSAGTEFPLIDAAFAWLEERWPAVEGAPVICWGDARPANVLFRDFEPVAVLDWEKVAIGPREVDIGWNLFFHQYFQRVAERHGYPGIADFMEPQRFVAAYTSATGYEPRDLDWYLAYAELGQALTSIRVSMRAVAIGQVERPTDPQDLIMDRAHLEELFSA